MPTADEVIVEFEARVDKYEADLRRSAATFERVTNAQKSQMQSLERQISGSASKIKSALAGLFAGLSVQEIAKLADAYTRFTNQLKVAGLEGERLAQTQEKLFGVAQQNGVELEAIGTLYSRAAQNQKELGASTQDLIDLTRAVAASLRISGTSTNEASGALLQLGQALGSPRVQAEEFNSLLDTMQPLLREAAKSIDGTGGTLAGLTRKIKDTKGPGVSAVELFRAMTGAMANLEKTASSTTLTISGAFTNLTNAVTKYIGEADRANAGTATVTAAINGLANNLDSLVEAITIVAVAMASRYGAAIGAATLATVAKAAADARATQTAIALTGATFQANRALLGEAAAANLAAESVSRLAVAQGVATRAGGALLAVVGGPVGAAALALGAAIYYVATASTEAEAAAEAYAKGQQRAAEVTGKLAEAADRVASAHGHARVEALALARAEAENVKQKLASARASLALAQAEATRQQAARLSSREPSGSAVGVIARGTRALSNALFPASAKTEGGRRADQIRGEIDGLKKQLAAANAVISAVETPSVAAAGTGAKDGKKNKGGASGPSATEIASRFNDELVSLTSQTLAARQSMARSAEEEAELAGRDVEFARLRTRDSIRTNKDYSDAQKKRLEEQLERLAEEERAAIEFRKSARLEQESQGLADERYRAEQAQLQNQYELANSQAERKQIALAMVDLEYRYQRSLLEAIIASETATEAEKERARVSLGALGAIQEGNKAVAARRNQSPLEAYRDRLPGSPDQINDQVEGFIVDELNAVQDSIASGISKAIGTKDPLITGLINLFIQTQILKPLANALAGSANGGSNFFATAANFVGSLFGGGTPGRAIGGPVAAGRPYKVGENGTELFVPQQSGVIVPSHALKGRSGNTINQTFVLDNRGGITTPELLQYVNDTARKESRNAGGGAFVASQQSTPGTLNKYNQLKG